MCEIYTNRTNHVNAALSDVMFSILNKARELEMVCGYVLDAPEQMPTGGWKRYGNIEAYGLAGLCSREGQVYSANSKALVAKLIASIKEAESV
jgi:hypothetical protein